MAKPEPDLDRLLRAAAQTREEAPEMPFGFDTRVVALARARGEGTAVATWELSRLLRRVVVTSAIVTLFAATAAYWQLSDNEQFVEPYANTYAIADTAIAAEFSP